MKKRSARPGDSRNHERRFSERQTARGEDDDNLATREGRPVRLPATTDAAEEEAEEVGGNALADGIAAAVDALRPHLRVDSARMASIKAENAGLSLKGSAVASDAFFPFRDGLDVVVNGGASCAIQPGGSMRDDEIIAAANEHGIAMIFTGTRHFRH